MIDFAALRRDWLSIVRADVLAGVVVALALIPEAIGFSIIAGVDPRVGLCALVAIAIVIAFVGQAIPARRRIKSARRTKDRLR